MRYPTLTPRQCAELSDLRLLGEDILVEPEWLGQGTDLDLGPMRSARTAISRLMPADRRNSELDEVEGKAAFELYRALEQVPIQILDDRGFWRYLSIDLFWDFIAWREREPFERGNHMRYVDGESNVNAVLPRMYLRMSALGGIEYAHLSSVVKRGTDFWRSHILRVSAGTAPPLTRALVRFQARHQLKRDDIRELAKRLSRQWTNVVLTIYDDDEAAALIEELAVGLVDTGGSDE